MWVPWAEGGLAFWVVGDNGDVVVWVVSLTPGGHAADVASGKVSAGADMGGQAARSYSWMILKGPETRCLGSSSSCLRRP